LLKQQLLWLYKDMTKFRQAFSELAKLIERQPSLNYCIFTDLTHILLRSD